MSTSYNRLPTQMRKAVPKGQSEIHKAITGTAAVLGVLLFAVLVAFVGVIAFSHNGSHHNNDDHTKTKIITSESEYNITVDDFGTCLGGATVSLYRLHRVGNMISGEIQGACLNTSSVGTSLNIDFGFGQFPSAFRCPTGNGDDPNVMGTGSLLIEGSNVASVVQIESNSDVDQLDMDVRFGSTVVDGSNLEFAVSFIYKANACP